MSELIEYFAFAFYGVLSLIAIWGAFCVVLVWMRIAQKRFRSEAAQSEFLGKIDGLLAAGNFESAEKECAGDARVVPQLALLAMANRDIGYSRVRQLLLDHFQRDVLADLEYRLSWVNTIIKTAPMVGLLGTVVGMMGAFAKLSIGDNVDATKMAGDISLALATTASGLAIAIPLVFCTAAINVRIRKMEDLVALGLNQFMSSFRDALEKKAR